ncbi:MULTISPECIES: SDR family oxidoreductase [unclassified Polynucleobacter]|uniref:SDR family oxidoreductase n=1 Tax=unclassified Polynucleobacter TaxID=2640945 RepID=UPI00092859CD|nr:MULTISPECIES: SDR family oxidoreductase [unclassified Polynucleobacter]MBU3562923.1 SDR family oxidoreductase [Polynucleobacter sp. Tro8-14-1]MEA9567950.1 SDR family oxidoreductase [Polynucleobacter sp. AP-Nickl1-40-C4]OJI05212.1 short chain dehydrogenase [Polynucleobacter sp. MWH-Adler-W8]
MNPSSTPPSQQGKAVLVTGAAKRLGREIALQFARQGWDVAVHYGRSEQEAQETIREIEMMGVKAQAFQADLADEAATKNLFLAVSKIFPNLACLVNSASIFEYDRANSGTPLSGKSLQDHMQVNLTAPILLSQQMFEFQKSKPNTFGVIPAVIQLLDQKLINLNPDYLSYTLSKAALLSSVELLAMDFAPHLRVVGLAPGISLPSGDQTMDGFSKAHQMTPLGRSSTPADIAKAAVFLADSSAITGTTLYVDGGQHLLPSSRDVMFKTN